MRVSMTRIEISYKRKFLISDELERSACSPYIQLWNPYIHLRKLENEIWKYSSQVGGIFRLKKFF